ncbi:Transposase (plasmid) [Shigella dysenteriae WRSd3]|uniref:Transposase n=1 Tax=Shigella dysenteriae WRSd3 TaxID=1401327 RepID=A0A090NA08_SHIDY|nr:Transposase [Shigella dysenteriae WRSd3]
MSGTWCIQERLLRPGTACPLRTENKVMKRLKLEIKVAHIRTRETYGTRRLQTELADEPPRVSWRVFYL